MGSFPRHLNWSHIKREKSSLPVDVRLSKTPRVSNSQNHIFDTFAPLETRKKLDRVDFCKARWDRYWGRTGQLLDNFFFVVPCNSPRSLCESKLGPVSFWFLKWRIVKYPFFSGIITGEESVSYWSIFFVVPSNSPRSLCESKLGPVSLFPKRRIADYSQTKIF